MLAAYLTKPSSWTTNEKNGCFGVGEDKKKVIFAVVDSVTRKFPFSPAAYYPAERVVQEKVFSVRRGNGFTVLNFATNTKKSPEIYTFHTLQFDDACKSIKQMGEWRANTIEAKNGINPRPKKSPHIHMDPSLLRRPATKYRIAKYTPVAMDRDGKTALFDGGGGNMMFMERGSPKINQIPRPGPFIRTYFDHLGNSILAYGTDAEGSSKWKTYILDKATKSWKYLGPYYFAGASPSGNYAIFDNNGDRALYRVIGNCSKTERPRHLWPQDANRCVSTI